MSVHQGSLPKVGITGLMTYCEWTRNPTVQESDPIEIFPVRERPVQVPYDAENKEQRPNVWFRFGGINIIRRPWGVRTVSQVTEAGNTCTGLLPRNRQESVEDMARYQHFAITSLRGLHVGCGILQSVTTKNSNLPAG